MVTTANGRATMPEELVFTNKVVYGRWSKLPADRWEGHYQLFEFRVNIGRMRDPDTAIRVQLKRLQDERVPLDKELHQAQQVVLAAAHADAEVTLEMDRALTEAFIAVAENQHSQDLLQVAYLIEFKWPFSSPPCPDPLNPASWDVLELDQDLADHNYPLLRYLAGDVLADAEAAHGGPFLSAWSISIGTAASDGPTKGA